MRYERIGDIKYIIWKYVSYGHTPGKYLSMWLRILHGFLFPLDTLHWLLSDKRGIQSHMDTFLFRGVHISLSDVNDLVNGGCYKFTRVDNRLEVEKLDDLEGQEVYESR